VCIEKAGSVTDCQPKNRWTCSSEQIHYGVEGSYRKLAMGLILGSFLHTRIVIYIYLIQLVCSFMVSGFVNVRFRASEKGEDELRSVGTRSMGVRGTGRPRSMDDTDFTNDESAARFYMRRVFEGDHRNTVRGLSPSDQSEAVPDMLFVGIQESPLTRSKLARFKQTHSTIPVFGSQAIVELDRDRELVSIDAEVAEIRGIPSMASISPAEALKKIETFTGATAESLQEVAAPELTYYHDDVNNSWHLAFLFKHVPAAPTDYEQPSSANLGHRLGKSPRQMHPKFNYLVDAHDAEILLYYSSNPLVGIPSKCYGIDEGGTTQEFLGNKTQGGFEMFDPLRAIKTYDLQGKDLQTTPSPAQPVHSVQSNWKDANKAAVSAHVNAVRIYRFYKDVLVRDGIDDKGMDLISVVNCIYEEDQPVLNGSTLYGGKTRCGMVSQKIGMEPSGVSPAF
jgi:bacillolysin